MATLTHSRDPYIIRRAFRSYLLASLATTVAQQLSIFTDATVVSNMIGIDAITAINLSRPLSDGIYCVPQLITGGAAMLASVCIGSQDLRNARRLFTYSVVTSTLLLTLFSLFAWTHMDWLVQQASPDVRYQPMVRDYLSVGLLCIPVTALCTTLCRFISVDGASVSVSRYFILASVLNIVFDIVAVGVLGLGVGGCAWATVISTVVSLLAFVPYHRRRERTIHFDLSFHRDYWPMLADMVKQGAPAALGSMLTSLCLYLLNQNILTAPELGSEAIYLWSICQQVLIVGLTVVTCCNQSFVSVGGMLRGEGDYEGLRILIRRGFTILRLIVLPIFLIYFFYPKAIVWIFGGIRAPEAMDFDLTPMRICSIHMFVYLHVVLINRLQLVLGNRVLSVVFYLIMTVFFMVVFGLMQTLRPDLLWWAFPLTIIPLVFIQMGVNWLFHRQQPDTSWYLLLPQPTPTITHYITVPYRPGAIDSVKGEMKEAMQHWQGTPERAAHIRAVTAELLAYMMELPHPRSRRAVMQVGLHKYIHSGQVTIKGVGPISADPLAELTIPPDIQVVRLYMYGQNVIHIY